VSPLLPEEVTGVTSTTERTGRVNALLDSIRVLLISPVSTRELLKVESTESKLKDSLISQNSALILLESPESMPMALFT
jgi:hypothetical protein